MYDLQDLGRMMADPVRMRAYTQALGETITRESVVLDLGAGTGIMALLACRFGARRVFAVETGDAVHVARELAQRNGFADRIEFFHADSTRIELPERADVIVADLRGVLPLHARGLAVMHDAVSRHLSPSGVVIPRRDTLHCALVGSPRAYRMLDTPWRDGAHGFDLEPARRLMSNRWSRVELASDELLAAPAQLGTIDYAAPALSRLTFRAQLQPTRPGVAHGFCVWFDAQLTAGAGFSNAPGLPPTVYGQAFFPWPEPTTLGADAVVDIELHAHSAEDSWVWTWNTRARMRDRSIEWRQSTFFAAPLDSALLERRAASHVVRLDARAHADRLALVLMEQGSPLGDIASRLCRDFESLFPSMQAALSHVADLSERYGA